MVVVTGSKAAVKEFSGQAPSSLFLCHLNTSLPHGSKWVPQLRSSRPPSSFQEVGKRRCFPEVSDTTPFAS